MDTKLNSEQIDLLWQLSDSLGGANNICRRLVNSGIGNDLLDAVSTLSNELATCTVAISDIIKQNN